MPSDADTQPTLIYCIGDSFTLGWGVTCQESYPAVLEQGLGPEFRVLNLGVAGYGLIAAADRCRTFAATEKPDAVVYLLDSSDFGEDASSEAESWWISRQMRRARYPLASNSYVASVPWGLMLHFGFRFFVWREGSEPMPPETGVDERRQIAAERLERPLASEDPTGTAATLAELERLTHWCTEREVKFYVALMQQGDAERQVYAHCQRLGVPVIPFTAYRELTLPWDFHLNPQGCRELAEAARLAIERDFAEPTASRTD